MTLASLPERTHVAAGPRVLVVSEVSRAGEPSESALAESGYRLTFVCSSSSLNGELRTAQFGLVHAYGWRAGADACLTGMFSSAPPVVVSLPDPASDRQYVGLSGQFRRWLTGRALGRAAAIVVPGDAERTALLRLFPNLRARQDRVLVISNGIEIQEPEPFATDGSVAYTPDSCGAFTVAYASGSCNTMLSEALARIERYGGVPSFRLATSEDCDLFVAPTREAWAGAMRPMCAGIPVLACVALREILAETPAHIYGPSVAELESALREALASPWTDFAQDYAPLARQRFDARRSAEQLIELYDRVTSATETPAP